MKAPEQVALALDEPQPPTTGARGEANAHLQRQLVRLGDMMGEGLHLEPGGEWIAKEYRQVATALGYPMRRRSTQGIDTGMAKALASARCSCGGLMVQSRSGSLRAACTSCGQRYQFKRGKASC